MFPTVERCRPSNETEANKNSFHYILKTSVSHLNGLKTHFPLTSLD